MDILSRWQGLSEEARLRFCLGLILTFSAEEETIPLAGDPHAWDELIAAGFMHHPSATPEQLRLTSDGGRALMHAMERHLFDVPVYAF
jgi:hypothetical protein